MLPRNIGGEFGHAESVLSGGGAASFHSSSKFESSSSSSSSSGKVIELPSTSFHGLETVHSSNSSFPSLTASNINADVHGFNVVHIPASSSSVQTIQTHSTAPTLVGVSKYEEVRYSSNVPKWEVDVPSSSNVHAFETVKHSSSTIPGGSFETVKQITTIPTVGFETISHSTQLPSLVSGVSSSGLGSSQIGFETITTSSSSNLPFVESGFGNANISSLGSSSLSSGGIGGIGSVKVHGFETSHSNAPGLVGVAKYEEVRYSSSNVPSTAAFGGETVVKHSSTIPTVGLVASEGFESIRQHSSSKHVSIGSGFHQGF